MSDSAAFYNTIARYYDAENEMMTEDLAFYTELAQCYGEPILDIGCGTGRVMLHLAAQNHRVAGIDVSEAMLGRGQRKVAGRADLRGRATFFLGDAASYPYPERYALILVPYNGFMHFKSQKAQIEALLHWREALAEGGLLVLDLPNAGEHFASADDASLTYERAFAEPESGNQVMQMSISRIDRAEQMQYITWVYDEIGRDGVVKRTLAPLTLHYVFAGELDLLLDAAGLERVDRYGDYVGSPFLDGCERLIVTARRAG